MDIKNLEQKFFALNQKLYNEAKDPLPSHGPWHHLKVWQNAKKLAKGKKVDWKVLAAACFLHDISSYDYKKVGNSFHKEDPKRAEKILRQIKFPEEKIMNIQKSFLKL